MLTRDFDKRRALCCQNLPEICTHFLKQKMSLSDNEGNSPTSSDEELFTQTEIVEQKIKLEEIEEKIRFVALTDEELTDIIGSAQAKGTKRNTKWIVNTVEGK